MQRFLLMARVCGPLLALTLFWAACLARAGERPDSVPATRPADSAVKWRAWNAEAFADARQRDRPIFLWIDTAWSHAGAEMTRAVFSDPPTAKILNEFCVPIRVDRDRRPDVDLRYQEAVLALGGGPGGWPLNVFLTPEGHAMAGGVAYLLEDDYVHERPGLASLVRKVAESWTARREETRKGARELDAHLRKRPRPQSEPKPFSAASLEQIVLGLQAALDPVGGGFGSGAEGPKFPLSAALELALVQHARSRDPKSLELVTRTLDGMLQGGIHDRLGGGFHRCAGDRHWRRPRFEKLLTVNAEMLRILLLAGQATARAEYGAAAEELLRWVDGSLCDRERGGFFASQAADAGPGDDGGYYTWTVKEWEAALKDDRLCELARLHCGVEEWGEQAETAPHRNVLYEALPLAEAARRTKVDPTQAVELRDRALAALRAARAQRRAPPVDRAILVDANARMVSALLWAAPALTDEPQSSLRRAFSLKTLDRLLKEAVDPVRGAAHVLEPDGTLAFACLAQDEAALAVACLDGYLAAGETRYLQAARACLARLDERFLDPAAGTYRDRTSAVAGAPEALGRLSDPHAPFLDTPAPAVNALAAWAHLRLAALTGEAAHAERARKTLEAFGGVLERLGPYGAALPLAADAALHGQSGVVVEGRADDPRTRALQTSAGRVYAPHRWILRVEPGDRETLARLGCPAAGAGELPCAHVLGRNGRTARTSEPAQLKALLEAAAKP